ncbi:MAG: hypothetical protein LKI94_09320 [Sporolactobacillus sp.]|jgi:hypothetical protein|nr:hypothetical protein [Sporolactobacillus sp.]MCI1882378.1 hypothetical protein [Sporolactobacillus sp.]
MNAVKYAQIDNYLDLYRYASELKDNEWQRDILRKLADLQNGTDSELSAKRQNLQQLFVAVNRTILRLYRRLNNKELKMTDRVSARLLALKRRRIELERAIDALRGDGSRICH